MTDQKALVVMVSNDTATLSQWLQCIMLHIHQISMCILYKPSANLYIADWLSQHNHTENRDQDIAGVNINIHTVSTVVDVPVCMLIEDLRAAMRKDAELQMPQVHKIKAWPQNKDETEPSLRRYSPIRHDLAMINGVAMKGK